MSQILKGNILNIGQLEEEIYKAINFFGCSDGYKGPTDPCQAQREFSQRLAIAISNAVSKGVQQYLLSNVTVIPGQLVVTAGSPTAQAGSTTTPGILNPQ
jgi:hypothetical protein